MKRITIIIEKDEDDYYIAEVKELPGCITQAKNLSDIFDRLKEAIDLYLDILSEQKKTEITKTTV